VQGSGRSCWDDLASGAGQAALALLDEGRLDAAEHGLRRLRHELWAAQAMSEPARAFLALHIARVLYRRGLWARARNMVGKAVASMPAAGEPGPSGLADALLLWARCEARMGDHAEAERILRRAAVAASATDPLSDTARAVDWELGCELLRRGQARAASQRLRRVWKQVLEQGPGQRALSVGARYAKALALSGEADAASEVVRALVREPAFENEAWKIAIDVTVLMERDHPEEARALWNAPHATSTREHAHEDAIAASGGDLSSFEDQLRTTRPADVTVQHAGGFAARLSDAFAALSPTRLSSWVENILPVLHLVGLWEQLEVPLTRLSASLEDRDGAGSETLADACRWVGECLWARGRWAEGESYLRRALEIAKDRRDSIDVEFASRQLGFCMVEAGRLEDALVYHYEAAAKAVRRGPDWQQQLAETDFAHVLVLLGRTDEAERLLRFMIGVRARAWGPYSQTCARESLWLARCLVRSGDTDQARGIWQATGHTVEATPRVQSESDTPLDVAWHRLAQALFQRERADVAVLLGSPDEALPLYECALELTTEAVGRERPDFAGVLSDTGQVLLEMGRTEEARAVLRRALDIEEKTRLRTHPRVRSLIALLDQVAPR
jgi:tetratricopeptide (TPR) repeat protein